MNNGNGDFDDLKKLLALKRHEQPPPRYFNDFSSRVLAGIETSSQAGFMSRFWDRFPSLERLRVILAQNPISAGVFATCGLLVVGFTSSQFFDTAAASANLAVVPTPFVSGDVAQNFRTDVRSEGIEMLPAMASPGLVQSTPDTLFNGGFNLQPVSYSIQQ